VADVLPRLTLQEKVNLLQTTPVNASEVPRLGIFRTGTAECLHGYCSRAPSTVFPQSTTLAASFNAPLLREVAAAVGLEARAWRNEWVANGSDYASPFPSLTCFAPQINSASGGPARAALLPPFSHAGSTPPPTHTSSFFCTVVRDPRWGRGQETYGEDPALTSKMVGAYVDGLQRGDGSGGPYMLAAATTKHFIGYQGASTRGQYSPTEVYVSWRDQIDTFEPAWRSAVRHGTAGVMCAYSSVCHDDTNVTCGLPPPAGFGVSDGIPMCANGELLNGWLRGGADGAAASWEGVVIGDCGAVQFIETDHRWVDSQEAAAAAALNNGVDVDCSISVGRAFAALTNATAAGLVNASTVDAALGRLLAQHLRLGLYDPPELVPWAAVPMAVVNSAAHRGLAARGAREGIVLLANGRGLLPLAAGALGAPGALLVTGPNANMVASGNYNAVTDRNVTAWAGIAAALPPGAAVYAPGCEGAGCAANASALAAVVAAARAARVVVFVGGLDGSQEYEDSTRASLALPGAQEALLAALAGAGTPLVMVLTGGSAVAPSPAALRAAAAVLWAGYGGEEAGTALADVLLGAYNPAGRLPFTFYANASHLPPYANMSMVGAPFGRTYRYFTGPPPAFRFGDGISYSRFTVALRGAAPPVLKPCDALLLRAGVANEGPLDGDAVVQVYVRLSANSALLVPRHALADFARAPVPNGGAAELEFSVPPDAFAVVDGAARARLRFPGQAAVFVGLNQPTEADWAGPQAVRVALEGPVTNVNTCGDGYEAPHAGGR
jgi:beta-glucosidase